MTIIDQALRREAHSYGTVAAAGVMCVLALCFATLPATVAPHSARLYETPNTTQIDRLLSDRPELAATLKSYETLEKWIAQEFAGSSTGLTVIWDPTEPESGRAAEHGYRADDSSCVVRVTAHLTGLDQMTGLIYELHNMRGARRFEEIFDAAVKGTIDKSDYVDQMLQQEFLALKETRKFLIRHIGLLSENERKKHRLFSHVVNLEKTLAAHIKKYERMGFDLGEYLERVYEQEVVPEKQQR